MGLFQFGNTFSVGNNGGRPPKYDSVESLVKEIDAYFTVAFENKEPLTITGLALALGFCSRQSLYDYEKDSEFSYIIKKAKCVVENGYEKKLHEGNATGAIFALKNMQWIDKAELDLGGQKDNPIKQEHRFIIEDMTDGSEKQI